MRNRNCLGDILRFLAIADSLYITSRAIERGVERAHIIDSEDGALLEELFTARRGFGTCISQDDYEAPHPEDWNDDFSVADGVTAGGLIEW